MRACVCLCMFVGVCMCSHSKRCVCSYSKGSIVVHYKLAVKKTAAAATLNTIVESVKQAASDGSFGNFTVDPKSVVAKSELIVIVHFAGVNAFSG